MKNRGTELLGEDEEEEDNGEGQEEKADEQS